MSKIISILTVIFLLLGAGASGLVGVGLGPRQVRGNGIAASTLQDDEPIDIVRSFWRLSLSNGLAGENLIGAPPKIFFDKPCAKGSSVVAVPSEVQNNWMRNSVMRLSERIAKHQVPGESIQLLSEFGDEAVVLVSYFDPSQLESVTILQYVFLYRTEGKWKMFMTLRGPVIGKSSYAGLRCTA